MDHLNATLSAQPLESAPLTAPAGLQVLGLGEKRDGLIYLPREHRGPLPLLVLLHGAGGKASQMLVPFRDLADTMGVTLLVPESRSSSWDIIRGGLGPDVQFINEAFKK